MASGFENRLVEIWNLTSYQRITSFSMHTNIIFGLKELKNGYLVSSSFDNFIKVWNINTESIMNNNSMRPFSVFGLEITDNGYTISCVNHSKSIYETNPSIIPPTPLWNNDNTSRLNSNANLVHLSTNSNNQLFQFSNNNSSSNLNNNLSSNSNDSSSSNSNENSSSNSNNNSSSNTNNNSSSNSNNQSSSNHDDNSISRNNLSDDTLLKKIRFSVKPILIKKNPFKIQAKSS